MPGFKLIDFTHQALSVVRQKSGWLLTK